MKNIFIFLYLLLVTGCSNKAIIEETEKKGSFLNAYLIIDETSECFDWRFDNFFGFIFNGERVFDNNRLTNYGNSSRELYTYYSHYFGDTAHSKRFKSSYAFVTANEIISLNLTSDKDIGTYRAGESLNDIAIIYTESAFPFISNSYQDSPDWYSPEEGSLEDLLFIGKTGGLGRLKEIKAGKKEAPSQNTDTIRVESYKYHYQTSLVKIFSCIYANNTVTVTYSGCSNFITSVEIIYTALKYAPNSGNLFVDCTGTSSFNIPTDIEDYIITVKLTDNKGFVFEDSIYLLLDPFIYEYDQ